MTIPRNLGTFAEYAGANNKPVYNITNSGETATVTAISATGTIDYNVITQSIVFYTSDSSGNWTLNIRGDATTTLNSFMSVGQSIVITHLVSNGSTAYYNNLVQIDGNSITPKWQGGSAPTSGNANTIDSYEYMIIKTANATFTVLAAQSKISKPTIDPYWYNVVLLMSFDGANGSTTFTDSSSYGTNGTSNNGAALSTANYEFAPSSFRSNVGPNCPYVSFSNANLNFGTGDLTVELWHYYNSSEAVGYGPFLDNGNQGIFLSYGSPTTNLLFYSNVATGLSGTTGAAHGMTNGTWNFLTFVRSGSTCYIFVNGNIIQTLTGVSGSLSPNGSGYNGTINTYSLTLGQNYWVGGYIDEMRITKGVARYTSNFTPPTAPFPVG